MHTPRKRSIHDVTGRSKGGQIPQPRRAATRARTPLCYSCGALGFVFRNTTNDEAPDPFPGSASGPAGHHLGRSYGRMASPTPWLPFGA
jgi:hypothetical protein